MRPSLTLSSLQSPVVPVVFPKCGAVFCGWGSGFVWSRVEVHFGRLCAVQVVGCGGMGDCVVFAMCGLGDWDSSQFVFGYTV